MKKQWVIGIVIILVISTIMTPIQAKEQATNSFQVEAKYYKDIQELKYPQVSGMEDDSIQKNINKTLEDYIKDSYESYQETIEKAEEQGFPFDYQSEFEVKYQKDEKLSILTSDYMFSGGAHGSTEVKSFNFDLTEAKQVFLTDILTTDDQIEQAKEYLWNYMKDRPNIFFPDVKKEDITLGKDTSFYFTDRGIAIVFQAYEVAPGVAGNQEIEIPKDVYQ
ncbi:DUF3298 and DUF4163 domain-containing protein [Aquibacillus sediminis]|uniref:DUF3298 and DUF4163 domain-containing protein n=1 Tax=Aquibacillus sediminis TaxID=2574734 RepID=UPI001485C495|nr:DUF3298 and DUF4163 domain-containing protein [Aquibacillus sediminis]